MEGDGEEQDPLKDVPKMLLPNDKLLLESYAVYKPSLYAELLTEKNPRTLFGEAVEVREIYDSIPRLSELCKNILSKQFRSGNLDPRISPEDLNYIAEHLDVDLPLVDIVDLENDAFWRRVFIAKCHDMKLKSLKLHDVTTDFKIEAIQLKLTEVIETTAYEYWKEVEMNRLAKAVAPYVNNLHISKLIAMKEKMVERDSNLAKYKIHNYPDRDCHHGSLEMVGWLMNLTKLELELTPPPLGYDYHRRYFLFSHVDMQNLVKGLKRLTSLTHLIVKRSQLDELKMKILVQGLLHLPLEIVVFSYCGLQGKSGLCIGKLLQNVTTIKRLELEGNNLDKDGLEPIAFSLRDNPGSLEYYGLARNPVSDDGVYMLGCAFIGRGQLKELNVNGILVSPEGAKRVVELLELHGKLRKVQMCVLPLGEDGGDYLIEFLKDNNLLYELECRGCDLTLEQEYKVRLLVGRNKYFFDNPTLMGEITTKDLAGDANEWTKRLKHPVLLKVKDLMEKRLACRERRKVTTSFLPEDMNPFFLHKKDIVQQTNSEILAVNFLESSGPDSEMKVYMPESSEFSDKLVGIGLI